MRGDGAGQRLSGRRRIWPRLVIVTIFVGALVAFFAFGGDEYLRLETVKHHRDALQAFVAMHYAPALLIAFLVYAAATAFSLPVAIVLSLTIGFLFGRWVGTAIVVTAATVGAALLFVAARYLFADAARKRCFCGSSLCFRSFSSISRPPSPRFRSPRLSSQPPLESFQARLCSLTWVRRLAASIR